jgi:hypothetical protein
MRIAAFIASIVIATALMMGGVFLLVVDSDDAHPIWLFVATFAMIMFVYGPLAIGSFRAYWNVSGSAESRRYFRRTVLVVVGLEILAAILIVVYSVATSATALIPAVFIGGGAILTVVALLVGPAFYRYDDAHRPASSGWVGIDPTQVRRRIIAVAVTFLGVLALGVIASLIVNAVAPRSLSLGEVFLFAVEFASIGGALVAIFSTLGWNRRLRDVADRDPSRLRRVSRVVLRGKKVDLDDKDLEAAARYAAVVPIMMGFQIAYFVLLYAALVLGQVSQLQNGSFSQLSIPLIVVLVGVLVVLLPLQISRLQRARHYSRDHPATPA